MGLRRLLLRSKWLLAQIQLPNTKRLKNAKHRCYCDGKKSKNQRKKKEEEKERKKSLDLFVLDFNGV